MQTLLNQLGALIRPRPKTESKETDNAPVVRPSRTDAQLTYPTVGITPQRMLALLHTADAGNPQQQFELYHEMLQKWPRLAAVEQTRRFALIGLDYEILDGQSCDRVGAQGEASSRVRQARGRALRCRPCQRTTQRLHTTYRLNPRPAKTHRNPGLRRCWPCERCSAACSWDLPT